MSGDPWKTRTSYNYQIRPQTPTLSAANKKIIPRNPNFGKKINLHDQHSNVLLIHIYKNIHIQEIYALLNEYMNISETSKEHFVRPGVFNMLFHIFYKLWPSSVCGFLI